MNQDVFIGIGSNLGDRVAHLQQAMKMVQDRAGEIISKSSFYETEPWGYSDQPYFLNAVVRICTSLSPIALLDTLLAIETEMGRKRTFKNAARVIDLDLLFYGQNILRTQRLILPHPLIQNRKFVLLPMSEMAPYWEHPRLHKNMNALLESTSDNLKVTIYETE